MTLIISVRLGSTSVIFTRLEKGGLSIRSYIKLTKYLTGYKYLIRTWNFI